MADATPSRKRTSAKTRTAAGRTGSTRKPSTRKPARARTRKEAPTAAPARTLEATAREIALAQLGIAAHVVETVGIRVIRARAEAPKQWDGYVKRGEQVRRDLALAGEGLRRQISDRVGKLDVRDAIEARLARARALAGIFSRRRATA